MFYLLVLWTDFLGKITGTVYDTYNFVYFFFFMSIFPVAYKHFGSIF